MFWGFQRSKMTKTLSLINTNYLLVIYLQWLIHLFCRSSLEAETWDGRLSPQWSYRCDHGYRYKNSLCVSEGRDFQQSGCARETWSHISLEHVMYCVLRFVTAGVNINLVLQFGIWTCNLPFYDSACVCVQAQ